MRKYLFLLLFLSGFVAFSQDNNSDEAHQKSMEDVYKEMEAMKKEYFDGLKKEKEAEDQKILDERETVRTEKLENNKETAYQRINETITERSEAKKVKEETIETKKKEQIVDNTKKMFERENKVDNRVTNKRQEQLDKINARKQALLAKYKKK